MRLCVWLLACCVMAYGVCDLLCEFCCVCVRVCAVLCLCVMYLIYRVMMFGLCCVYRWCVRVCCCNACVCVMRSCAMCVIGCVVLYG